ncbi:MAG: exodeoxyribonuclease VII large subunit [Planctomycetes bacterium]|nr:exodeoxyribonuclease VII large subunit [Planctomycetota bacterium]
MNPFPPDDIEPLTISALTRDIKTMLEVNYPQGVWVTGEVSNLARPSSGHLYLKLKDAESQLNTVIYRGVALRLRFDLQDGMEVIAKGRLIVYVPRGEYQLQVEEIQPKGIGPLELAFRQLKEKLSIKGYFEPRRKKTLPRFPSRVVLVTSPTGAAVRDMLEVLNRRWPALEVWVCPVPVQGDGAAAKIAEAITTLNTLSGIDVLIVGRGGGSLEDLWPFNEEVVADAIHASRIPVVSGVGHETDLTIADLVADVRALTPSEAAERVVPNRMEVLEWLDGCGGRMRTLLKKALEVACTRLAELAKRRCFRQPLGRIREEEQRLDDWAGRLQRAGRTRMEQARQRLEALAARLDSLSPLNVLGRGYSLTRKAGDTVVLRDARQARPGDFLVTYLRRGRILSRVEQVELDSADGSSANGVAAQDAQPEEGLGPDHG